MRKLLIYYLAFFTWIAIIIMFLSIILIPIYKMLSDDFPWWERPFTQALFITD